MVSSTTKLFKGTYAWHVTSNLLHLLLGFDGKVPSSSSSNTSFEVSEVDFFICHSWSCPASLKALAVCHRLNLNLAIATSIFAFLLAISTILLCGGPHVSPYSGVAEVVPYWSVHDHLSLATSSTRKHFGLTEFLWTKETCC